jgi:hypothetical protein
MKTINATLLAAQKVPTGQAFATAALADNSRLHPVSVATAANSGGNVIGCWCGTFYMRLRIVASVLTVQKITDPTIAAQWNTWVAFEPFEAGTTYGIAIFWTGTYVVICYEDYTATGDIKYRRSSDGVVFSAIAVARAGTPALAINISGISAPSPRCGLLLSYGQRAHFRRYDHTADTWSVEDDNGFNLTTVVPQIAGFWDSINSRYVIVIETTTFVAWAAYALVLFTRPDGAPAQAWSAGQVLFGGAGAHYKGLAFCQSQINGYWWLSFSKTRLWTTSFVSTMLISTSNDGLFWEDPLPTAIDGTHLTLELYPPLSVGKPYLATEAEALRLDTYTYWSTAPVMQYSFNTGHGALEMAPLITEDGESLIIHPLKNKKGHPIHNPHTHTGAITNPASNRGPSQARLTVKLDNRDGSLIAPRIFSVFTLTRGLIVAGVSYAQSAGVYYVTGYRYYLNDLVLEIDATDAHGLLATWFSHNVFTYNGQTVKQLVETVCALAGVHTVTFDGFSAWTDTIATYAQPVGVNAHYSLSALAKRVPFEFLAREDGSLYFYVPTSAPASVYAYGAGVGEHTLWPGVFGAQDSVTYIQAVGGTPRSMVAEALDTTTLYDQGRKGAALINERSLTVDTQATTLAGAALVQAQEKKHHGVFEAPPNFALEPGDVINFGTGSAYANAVGPWRVEEFEEHFNQPGAKPFFQKITVRGTA